MDLKERIRDVLNSLGLPVEVKIGYLTDKDQTEIRLQQLPGSTVIEEDYGGNKTEQYHMEVAMRGGRERIINESLWKVANALGDNDFRVVSKDGSFIFSKLDIASFPHPIMADTTGAVTYVFDFNITIDTFEKG